MAAYNKFTDFDNTDYEITQRSLDTEYDDELIEEKSKPLTIKSLGFPPHIEKKLFACVNYYKTKQEPFNLLLVGCPLKYVSHIRETIANELGVNLRTFDGDFSLKLGDLTTILTNMSDNDLLCITHIEKFNADVAHLFEQAILDYEIDVVIGKGPASRKFTLKIPVFNSVIAVENLAQVPSVVMDEVYQIIDFTKFDYELRMIDISDFAKKNNLSFSQEVKEKLAKQFTKDEDLKIQLIEIRSQASEYGVSEITESFLQGNLEPIPELEEVNNMDGREFELFTGNLFRALGYTNVTVTQASGDFGADVIAEKDDVRFAIQCKRYSAPVGVSAVQEVMASKSLHDCHVACILTNNSFTPAALELARKNLVILWGGDKLKEFIERAK